MEFAEESWLILVEFKCEPPRPSPILTPERATLAAQGSTVVSLGAADAAWLAWMLSVVPMVPYVRDPCR